MKNKAASVSLQEFPSNAVICDSSVAESEGATALRAAHTPGPWRYAPTNSGHYIAGNLPGYIAEVRHVRTTQDPAADARLIAAAPELLSALYDALEDLAAQPGADSGVIAAGRRAIRGARS